MRNYTLQLESKTAGGEITACIKKCMKVQQQAKLSEKYKGLVM